MINLDDRLLDRLDDRQMWLLLHIVKRINRDGVCWPSMGQILKDTKWKDERTVKRVRDELVEMKIIKVSTRMKQTGGQTSNLFSLETDQIGVFVTAKRLQEMQGPGVHEMGGRPSQNLQGPGVHEMGGEVLTKEVLTIENPLSPANEKIKEIEIPEPTHVWGDNTDTRYETALQTLKSYFEKNSFRRREISSEARNTCDENQFDEELTLWLRRYADDFQITQNPVKALTSGRGCFISWLSQSFCRAKYQTNGNDTSTQRNGRVQQQRKSETFPSREELERKYGLLQP